MYPYGFMNEAEQLRRSKDYGRMLAHEWRMANGSTPLEGRRPAPARWIVRWRAYLERPATS